MTTPKPDPATSEEIAAIVADWQAEHGDAGRRGPYLSPAEFAARLDDRRASTRHA